MFRAFSVTPPDNTGYHNLYSLLVGQPSASNIGGYGAAQGGSNETGVTGAIPTGGILPDKVGFLFIFPPAGGVNVADGNYTNTSIELISSGVPSYTVSDNKNTINLKDYWLKLVTSGAVQIAIEVR